MTAPEPGGRKGRKFGSGMRAAVSGTGCPHEMGSSKRMPWFDGYHEGHLMLERAVRDLECAP